MAVFSLCAVGSTVMSEHAVAVMVFPIVRDIDKALALKRGTSPIPRRKYRGFYPNPKEKDRSGPTYWYGNAHRAHGNAQK